MTFVKAHPFSDYKAAPPRRGTSVTEKARVRTQLMETLTVYKWNPNRSIRLYLDTLGVRFVPGVCSQSYRLVRVNLDSPKKNPESPWNPL